MSPTSWTPPSRRTSPREAAPSAVDLGAHGTVCADFGDLLLGSSRTDRDNSAPQNTGLSDSDDESTQARNHEPEGQPGADDQHRTHRGIVDRLVHHSADWFPNKCDVICSHANQSPANGLYQRAFSHDNLTRQWGRIQPAAQEGLMFVSILSAPLERP